MPVRPVRLASLAALSLTCLALVACDAGGSSESPDAGADERTTGVAGSPAEPRLETNLPDRTDAVPVSTLLEVTATDAVLDRVRVTSEAGELPGELSGDGTSWQATERLEPGTTYSVRASGEGAHGETVRERGRFTTQALTLDEQTYASVAPLDGETVGVGMPVVVKFDLPVTDHAAFEKQMKVTSTPAQPGSWHWLDDNEVHWRPKKYWQPGTEVSVDVDVNGVDAGQEIYGQEDREVDFTVGDAHVYKVDVANHRMQVFSNGKLLRTLQVTNGKPGFTTRSGTKVIMEKYESKRMASETVGIPAGSAEAYDIDNVQWAMRTTSSGEFIHAAPWSVGSQGHANVSHGCTGMSVADAGWLYSMTRRGDVVEYTGTDRAMEPYNGWGDWNIPFPEYKQGSALS